MIETIERPQMDGEGTKKDIPFAIQATPVQAAKTPARLFNFSLDENVRLAIDIHQGDKIDEAALKELFHRFIFQKWPKISDQKQPSKNHIPTTKSPQLTIQKTTIF
jgi:hypothetical protein